MQHFSKATKNWNQEINTTWVARDYLAIKMILSASVMLTSVEYANKKNLRIVEPYPVYYTLLNCARAVAFTSPKIDWNNGELVTMTHSKIINVVSDIISSFNKEKGNTIKILLEKARDYRELFSYKFPANGINDYAIKIEDAIENCRLLAEIAQFQSELLEKSHDKNVSTLYELDWEFLRVGYEYEGTHYTFLDDEDWYRLNYISRKQKRPYGLYLTMSEGMVEDFFGAWCTREDIDDQDDIYNPDENWRIIFPVP